MLAKIKEVFQTFVIVNTFVVIGTALYITIFGRGPAVNVNILWQLLFVSFTTSIGVLIYKHDGLSHSDIIIRTIIYYIYVNVIVLVCGFCFHWYVVNDIFMVIGMLVFIGLVFFFVSLVCWKRVKEYTNEINARLQVYQQEQLEDQKNDT